MNETGKGADKEATVSPNSEPDVEYEQATGRETEAGREQGEPAQSDAAPMEGNEPVAAENACSNSAAEGARQDATDTAKEDAHPGEVPETEGEGAADALDDQGAETPEAPTSAEALEVPESPEVSTPFSPFSHCSPVSAEADAANAASAMNADAAPDSMAAPDAANASDAEAAPEADADDFDLIEAARSVTEAGSRSVADGISAMREVSRAKRAHAKARETLQSLKQKAQDEAEELAHRRDIEHNYDEILKVQRAEILDARATAEQARRRQASLEAKRDEAKARLKRMKADNERRISPYRELADGAKGILDNAERAYSEARRGLRAAQAQADDATNSRDSRLTAANRAVDGAADRLARLQDQLAQMRRNPATGAKEISEASGSVAAALAQLENARQDVARVKAETGRVVEIAQTHLFTQRKSLEEAEADLESARTNEQEKRETHRKLREEAEAQERDVQKEVDGTESDIDEAKRVQTESQGRIEAAEAAIEEAEDIHAHPEATLELERQARESREAAEAQHQQVEVLADEERDVRERTKRARLTLMGAVAAIVVLVAVIALLVLGLGR